MTVAAANWHQAVERAIRQREKPSDHRPPGTADSTFALTLADLARADVTRTAAEFSPAPDASWTASRSASEFEDADPYTLNVAIGDGAVRFNERPVVGSCGLKLEAAHVLVETAKIPMEAKPTVRPVVEPVPSADHVPAPRTEAGSADTLRVSAARGENTGADVRITLRISTDVAKAGSQDQRISDVRAGRISLDFERTLQNATARHDQWSDAPTSSRTMIFARILTIDGTYRVRTRGLALTPDEADHLAERVRAVLREYGLADGPVVIYPGSEGR